MILTMTDALDESQTVSIIWAIGDKWWGSLSTYASLAFTDNITVNETGWSNVTGAAQGTVAYDDLAADDYIVQGHLMGASVWNATYDGLFSGDNNPPSGEPRIPLIMQNVTYKLTGTQVRVGSQGRFYGDLLNSKFLNMSSNALLDEGWQGELKARYKQEYVNNLFSSGKMKLKFTFIGMTRGKVSFKLIEAGGQSLSNDESIADRSAPVIISDYTTNAVRGVPYALPEARAYDNFDGEIGAGFVSLTGPMGVVAPVNGIFTPAVTGDYTAAYTSTDASGNTANKNYTFTCFDSIPPVSFFKKNGSDPAAAYNAKNSVVLPAYGASSALSLRPGNALDVSVVVQSGGVTAAGFADAGQINAFVVPRAGIYTVNYVARDEFGFMSSYTAYTFTAAGEAPQILIPSAPLRGVYGQSYTFPAVYTLYQDQYYRCSASAVSPSGITLTPNKNGSVPLDELGEYTANFSCTVGEQTVTESVVLHSLIPNESLFTGKDYEYITGDTSFPAYAADHAATGVLLTAQRAAEFTFDRILDLSGISKNINLIQFLPYSTPDKYGSLGLTVTLTDLHDPSNRVIITFIPHGDFENLVYIQVNYDGRTLARYTEFGGDVKDWPNYGSLHTLYHDGGYKTANLPQFYLRYDNAEKAIYAYNGATPWQLLDLDDAAQVGTGREWRGWTTGEVFMSFTISPGGGAAGLIVTEVAGQPLAGDRLWSGAAPKLYLNAPDNFLLTAGADNGVMPTAKTGFLYNLPTARAYDGLFGDCLVNYSLYLDSASGVNLWPSSGGAFIPASDGAYTLEISSGNLYGNTTRLKYHFTAATSVTTVTVSFGAPETAYAGLFYTLPSVSFSGGSGGVTHLCTATLNGVPMTPDSLNRVYLSGTGTLLITVTATDYLRVSVIDTLTVNVTARFTPVLTVSGVPHSAISGQTLYLPDFTAINYNYASGAANYNAWRTVSVNGTTVFSGRGTSTVGGLNYSVMQASGSLTVIYGAGNTAQNITETQTFTIPVLNPTYISDFVLPCDISTGVYNSSGITAARGSSGSVFTVNGDRAFVLANPVAADGMVLEFGGKTSAANMTSFTLLLEDCYHAGTVLSFEITMLNGQSYIRPFGGSPVPIVGSFLADNANYYVRYSASRLALLDSADNVICPAGKTLSGEAFTGFPGGAVRVRFEARGASGQRAFVLRQAGNQMFTASNNTAQYADTTGPQLVYSYPMSSRDVKLGSQITVASAAAYDILNPFSYVTVSVRNPQGTLIYDNADCGGARFITAESYGMYTITYTARDGTGRLTEEIFIYYVRDDIPPEITLNGAPPQTLKAGETMTVPSAVATDNYSAATLFIYVVTPDGALVNIGMSLSYMFGKSGVFKIVYYAYDMDYNVALKEFIVTVAE
jgi:hypothetical protein